MSDADATKFLASLRKASSSAQLYPIDHPYARDAIGEALVGAGSLTEEDGEAVLSIVDGGFYLNKRLLAQASVEHRTMLAQLVARGIESVTFTHPVARSDLQEMVLYLSEDSTDLPAGGTIRFNDKPFTRADLLEAATMSTLRHSYASSLDILRGVGLAVLEREEVDVSDAVGAVEGLLEQVLSQQGASLLLATLKTHDEYTFFHCVNVCILALSLGQTIGLNEEQLLALGVGGLLHDIGKVRVPPEVITHPGRLSDAQWADIKLHPQEGAQAILAASGHGQEVAARVALEHHARYDLGGYPQVRGRSEIHLFSRMVAVCDVYDAMTTRRSYKRAEPPNRALQVLLDGMGTQLDPDLVRAFINMMGIYPTGSLVRLDGGELVVVLSPGDEARRPLAAVIRDGAGNDLGSPEPLRLDIDRIVEQLLPEQAGLHPATMLEERHIAEMLASEGGTSRSG